MSHSIHMLSIQIDTKSYEFNKIKLSFLANRKKRSFSLIGVVRLLDTLEQVLLCREA